MNVGDAEALRRRRRSGGGEFLTGDLNLVRVQAVVQYRVASPAELVVRGDEVEGLLERLAEASLSHSLAGEGSTRCSGATGNDRRRGRPGPRASDARLRLGLEILGVSLTEARPPAEVAADFAAAVGGKPARPPR